MDAITHAITSSLLGVVSKKEEEEIGMIVRPPPVLGFQSASEIDILLDFLTTAVALREERGLREGPLADGARTGVRAFS